MSEKRRREDPEVRRAQILAAAKRAFHRFGLQATTVDSIAAEAQVSVGLLYRFFKSKTAMVEALIVEDVELQLTQVELALKDASAGVGDLAGLITGRLADATADRERLALMLEIAAEICRNSELGDFVRKARADLRNELVSRLGSQGLDRTQANALIEQLDKASAVATGLALHTLIYSASVDDLSKGLAKVVEAAVSDSR